MGTTATLALLLASVGSNPIEDVASDQVDLIEINHFHNEQGQHVFDQIIFYDWSPEHSRYQVRAFRMLKSPAQLPRRNWQQGGFDTVWHDSQNGDVLRKVHSQSARESWTQHDPELVEREFLAKEKRRDLRKVTTGNTTATLARQRAANDRSAANERTAASTLAPAESTRTANAAGRP